MEGREWQALVAVGGMTVLFGALLRLPPGVSILGVTALGVGGAMGGWAWIELPRWVRRRGAQMQDVAEGVRNRLSRSDSPASG